MCIYVDGVCSGPAAFGRQSATVCLDFGLACSWTFAPKKKKEKVKVVKTANRFTVNQSKMNKTGNALMVWTALAWLKLDRHAKYLS